MPQIFHPSTNTISRVTVFGALALLVAVFCTGFLNRSPYINGRRVVREQPIPFSHRHHVSDDGIDCRYCHTSVETSSFAGIPPTKTCMNCHSVLWSDSAMLEPLREAFRTGKPIEWVRVHDLPDFVYFNHSIHVAKGVGCVTCHGRIDEMALTYQENTLQMEWCVNCHRQPERYLRPRDRVFDMTWTPTEDQQTLGARLVREYDVQRLTSCSTCHR